MLKHYRYIGEKPRLQHETALGQWKRGNFYVQVDDLRHRWSHGWHITDSADWELDRDDDVWDSPEFISAVSHTFWLPGGIQVDQPAMVGQLHGETIMVHYAPGQREMAEQALTNIGAKVSPYCPSCSLLSIIVDGHWACCGVQA